MSSAEVMCGIEQGVSRGQRQWEWGVVGVYGSGSGQAMPRQAQGTAVHPQVLFLPGELPCFPLSRKVFDFRKTRINFSSEKEDSWRSGIDPDKRNLTVQKRQRLEVKCPAHGASCTGSYLLYT